MTYFERDHLRWKEFLKSQGKKQVEVNEMLGYSKGVVASMISRGKATGVFPVSLKRVMDIVDKFGSKELVHVIIPGEERISFPLLRDDREEFLKKLLILCEVYDSSSRKTLRFMFDDYGHDNSLILRNDFDDKKFCPPDGLAFEVSLCRNAQSKDQGFTHVKYADRVLDILDVTTGLKDEFTVG